MIKKVIIASMLTSMFASWGYATYRYFTPEVAPEIYQSTLMDLAPKAEKMMMLSPVTTVAAADSASNEEAEKEAELEKTKVVYYCNLDNQDCGFVDSQVLSVINAQLGDSLFDVVEYQDVNALEVQSSAKRKSEYGFANYPAIVKSELDENGKYIVKSCLQYDPTAPWTVEQLQEWLVDQEVVSFE